MENKIVSEGRMGKKLEKWLKIIDREIKEEKNLSPMFETVDEAIAYLREESYIDKRSAKMK